MPTANWNDPIDETFDWSEVGTFEQFRKAVYERVRIADYSDSDITAIMGALQVKYLLTPVTTGTDVQIFNYIFWWQKWLATISPVFCSMLLYEEGVNRPIDDQIYLTLTADIFNNTGGFRRKRPREITSVGATSDSQGNARAVGQRAIYTGGFSSPALITGKVYIYNGGAQWVLDTQLFPPDTLDSWNLSPPNRVNTDFNGVHSSGDYIGYWLFQEIRDVCNAMTWTVAPRTSLVSVSTNQLYNSNYMGKTKVSLKTAGEYLWTAVDPSSESGAYNAAQALAVAAFENPINDTGWFVTSPAAFISCRSEGMHGYSVSNSRWEAYYGIVRSQCRIVADHIPTFRPKSVHLYLYTNIGAGFLDYLDYNGDENGDAHPIYPTLTVDTGIEIVSIGSVGSSIDRIVGSSGQPNVTPGSHPAAIGPDYISSNTGYGNPGAGMHAGGGGTAFDTVFKWDMQFNKDT